MELIVAAVVVVVVISAATIAAPRLGLASPLVLVAVGIVYSLLPFTPQYEIGPELILAGLLPPLLYAAAVSMPTMDFRRDFTLISGMSVMLVLISSLLLGLLFTWVIPGIDYPLAVALGAIVSPTDAVATAIVKDLGVSRRIVTVLEGESMLNDATALVLLRTAVAAIATSVHFWAVLGQFVWAVVGAVAIGWLVGELNLRIRARLSDSAVNTAVSFTVPFVAYVPAEQLNASGLVAAVTAGIVTGYGAARYLAPQHRISDAQNWRTVELLLEGFVFLIMGLEISGLVEDVGDRDGGVAQAALVAAIALTAAMAIRLVYVAGVVLIDKSKARRVPEMRTTLEEWGAKADKIDSPRADRLRTALRRKSADVDYLDALPLGRREGLVIAWAGLRGAVTVAAAQTLPHDIENRSQLILIAFFVALFSLVVQGGTLAALVRLLGLSGRDVSSTQEEWDRLRDLMNTAADEVVHAAVLPPELAKLRTRFARPQIPKEDESDRRTGDEHRDIVRKLRLDMIDAQRSALLRERADGTYSTEVLSHMLAVLDADQIGIELRARPDED